MIKLIAIVGKSGSGKDTFLKEMMSHAASFPIRKVIGCTTRPKRDNEIDGEDYHFLTNEDFADRVLNHDIIEAAFFREWCYGTLRSDLSQNYVNIGIFNPEAVEILKTYDDIDMKIIYIEAADKVRLMRSLEREEDPDCYEIIRRFKADEEDFVEYDEALIDVDFRIRNDDSTMARLGWNVAKILATLHMDNFV